MHVGFAGRFVFSNFANCAGSAEELPRYTVPNYTASQHAPCARAAVTSRLLGCLAAACSDDEGWLELDVLRLDLGPLLGEENLDSGLPDEMTGLTHGT